MKPPPHRHRQRNNRQREDPARAFSIASDGVFSVPVYLPTFTHERHTGGGSVCPASLSKLSVYCLDNFCRVCYTANGSAGVLLHLTGHDCCSGRSCISFGGAPPPRTGEALRRCAGVYSFGGFVPVSFPQRIPCRYTSRRCAFGQSHSLSDWLYPLYGFGCCRGAFLFRENSTKIQQKFNSNIKTVQHT